MKNTFPQSIPNDPLPDNFLYHVGGAVRGKMKTVYQGREAEHYPYYIHDVRMLVQGTKNVDNLRKFIENHKRIYGYADGPFLGIYNLEQYEITENTIGVVNDKELRKHVKQKMAEGAMSDTPRNIV